ncbi:Ykof family thiamine-binding protein [Actinotalea sp. K2]|uniref:Ykof family thiamine-binding protein n=1 Tax=Actinotalea sp. K2 TaxID=2939438 RepID=UPI002017C517|nr:Ykof family thiamine-binding protein [Actinotalea sp. K2]MCL3862558.1 Ykof family thiamine-binding protein [Actinotalea sp. K2]
MTLDQSTSPEAPTTPPTAADHVRLGVGARFTLHPAADDVVPVILGALAAGRAAVPSVTVRTDDVSTLLRGSEQDLALFLTTVVAHAAEATGSGHVVATVALSRGCPGEVGCELPAGDLVAVPRVVLESTGHAAAAHWALYPLGVVDAMGPIASAIDLAREAGTWGGAENFATRLDGDLAEVIATFLDTWTRVGREVAHVAAHATISVGSPSSRAGAR